MKRLLDGAVGKGDNVSEEAVADVRDNVGGSDGIFEELVHAVVDRGLEFGNAGLGCQHGEKGLGEDAAEDGAEDVTVAGFGDAGGDDGGAEVVLRDGEKGSGKITSDNDLEAGLRERFLKCGKTLEPRTDQEHERGARFASWGHPVLARVRWRRARRKRAMAVLSSSISTGLVA